MNKLVVPLQLQGDGGVVGRVLTQQNVLHTETLGALSGLVLDFAVVYVVGKVVVSSAPSCVLGRRGAGERAKKSLTKIATLVVTFVALDAGFAFAGPGNILQSFATIGAAVTLIIGFATQDVIANFVAGIFTFTDEPFHIND